MQLADLLTPERIVVPLRAETLREALGYLVTRLEASGALTEGPDVEELVAGVAEGRRGEWIEPGNGILVVAARTPLVEDLSVALGIAPEPFAARDVETVAAEGPEGEEQAEPEAAGKADASTLVPRYRALFLLLTPRRLSTLKVQVIPSLIRLLRDEERAARLLGATTPADVRAFQELVAMGLHERLLVEDALTPLTYRVYPDTPVEEVVDLMVRRGLRAVPVVGEKYEVLGIVTSGDALRHLLPRRRSGDGDHEAAVDPRPATARDVMTRSVMCVSEDQSLMEAANMMVNKKVEQLPVVREGELIGFVTRDAILTKLFGS